MIKAKADRGPEKGPLYVFGLSHINLERLKAGDPIVFDLSSLGERGNVFIFSGETEEKMQQMLRDQGLLPADKASKGIKN